MSEQKIDDGTIHVPKTFLTYLLGIFIGGILGAGIVFTAIQLFRGAAGIVFFSCSFALLFGLGAWSVGEPR